MLPADAPGELTRQSGGPRAVDLALALVLLGAGVSLLTLAFIQGRLTQAIFAPRAAPLQLLMLLGFAATLWGMAFVRFARGFGLLRRPVHAAIPLFQATGLNVAALYLAGFALILAHMLLVGGFPFDLVNRFEVGGLGLLGLWLAGWGCYDLACSLRPQVRRWLVEAGRPFLPEPVSRP